MNRKKCAIPTHYCGNSTTLPKSNDDHYYYVDFGTRNECLKKGFGAAKYQELLKTLEKKSLQNIKYVGEIHEDNFKKYKIKNTRDLVSYANKHNIEHLLRTILIKKDGRLDGKAYNSILLFLDDNNVENLPSCKKL